MAQDPTVSARLPDPWKAFLRELGDGKAVAGLTLLLDQALNPNPLVAAMLRRRFRQLVREGQQTLQT